MIRSQEKGLRSKEPRTNILTFILFAGFTIPNSHSQCLLENWVEERNTKVYDEGRTEDDVLKHGHSRLLSIKDDPLPETTYRHDYIPLDKNLPERKYVGPSCRRGFLKQMFTQRAIEELQREEEERIQREIAEKMQSETAASFWKHRQLWQKPNTMVSLALKLMSKCLQSYMKEHDLVKEQPITFWTEHRKQMPVRDLSEYYVLLTLSNMYF